MITAKEAREQVDKLLSLENHCYYIEQKIRAACSKGLSNCSIRTSIGSNPDNPDSLDLLMCWLSLENNKDKLKTHLEGLGYSATYTVIHHPEKKADFITLTISW